MSSRACRIIPPSGSTSCYPATGSAHASKKPPRNVPIKRNSRCQRPSPRPSPDAYESIARSGGAGDPAGPRRRGNRVKMLFVAVHESGNGRYCCKVFLAVERATLIQDQAQMRNVDSKVYPHATRGSKSDRSHGLFRPTSGAVRRLLPSPVQRLRSKLKYASGRDYRIALRASPVDLSYQGASMKTAIEDRHIHKLLAKAESFEPLPNSPSDSASAIMAANTGTCIRLGWGRPA
jgi:hypothetical protein